VPLGTDEFRQREARWAASAPNGSQYAAVGEGGLHVLGNLRLSPTASMDENTLRGVLRDEGLFDANLNPGVQWTPIVEDGPSDAVVIQPALRLMWQRFGSPDAVSLNDALRFIDELNAARFAGHGDWRLPTLLECMSLMTSEPLEHELHVATAFDTVQKWIWSSTPAAEGSVWTASYGWGASVASDPRLPAFVRAVRWLD
jgi:hypothetical protein